jgi:hypothetical protein
MPRVVLRPPRRPWIVACAGLGLLAAAFAVVPRTPASPPSLRYQKRRAAGVGVHVITVNLNDPNVKVAVALARGGLGRRESFRGMLRRTRPVAAMTGTFFGLRSPWPTGDIVIDGHHVYSGFIGTAVAITPENRVRFVRIRRGQERSWDEYQTVLGGGPRLLTRGRITLAPRAEGFRDRSLYARRPRTAVGVTRRGKLLLVTVRKPIYLRRLARVMRALGARDAVAMDGGNSTAMFYRGRFVSRPARSLTNLLVVYDSSRSYNRARWRLAPRALLARHDAPVKPPTLDRVPVLPPGDAFSAREVVVDDAVLTGVEEGSEETDARTVKHEIGARDGDELEPTE